MKARSLQLIGRHYTTLGPLAVAEFPDGGAVALSRGALRKAYRYVDPNEDAVLLLRDSKGSVLAVADGYNGTAASELAIERVAQAGPELILTPKDRFHARMEQLAVDISRELRELEPSRSCLFVCVVVDHSCRWFCLGDSALFRASAAEATSPTNDLVLEPRLQGLPRPREFWSGHHELKPGERIAVVSDGVTNFVTDTRIIQAALTDADSDADAARGVAVAAMRGGAGDNIAIATIRVT